MPFAVGKPFSPCHAGDERGVPMTRVRDEHALRASNPSAHATRPRWTAAADTATLCLVAGQRIEQAAAQAIHRRRLFLIVLAGGNTPRTVYRLLRKLDTDWSRWQIYFGDERCLPNDAAGRNSRMAATAWLDHVPIPRDQIHIIPAERGPEAGARAYAETMADVGSFDLVLLGLGDDGHTAALFPGQPWGEGPGSADAIPILNAPTPPVQRVSLSARRLSRTRELLFIVSGESKRRALARWRAGAALPVRSVDAAASVEILFESALLARPATMHVG